MANSQSRAFFIIDSLTPGCWVWTKRALLRLGTTLAAALKQPCPVGIAVLHRSKPGQPAQLQILLRLGSSFQAKEYLSCIKRLPPASGDSAASDGAMMSSALAALMQHMEKLPARPDCRNHVFMLASSFASCVGNGKMQKLLQVVSRQTNFCVHFLQLTGPEAELQAAASELQDQQQQHDQPGPATAAEDASTDAAFHQMLKVMARGGNITYDAFVADCDAMTDLLCQSWLRELLAPAHGSSSSNSDGATTGQPGAGYHHHHHNPDLILRFGNQTLPCSLQQHILQLDPWLLPAHLCPCHNLPMQPCNSSSAAAAHAAAAAASSDAGSMAALLVQPEASPWACCLTGQPVAAPLSSCRSDARILQLGRHTQLVMQPTAAAAAPSAAAGGLAQHQQHHDDACSAINGQLRMLHALPMAPTQSFELTTHHMVPPSAVDSMLLYGMPLLLLPTGAATAAAPPAQDAAHAGAGWRDQGSAPQQQPAGVSHSEAGMLMRALCRLLLEQQQVLLASSHHDLLRRVQLPLLQWFMLQPAADGSCLLLRQVACREQLLPPKFTAGSALGSTVGGGGMTGSGGGESVEDQVVLLDAEQLESVKASLAGLNKGLTGSNGSSNGSSSIRSSAGQGGGELAATSGDALPETAADAADAADMCSQEQTPEPAQPLLLSCGLEAWVTAVLEASSSTYTPPPPQVAVAAPPQVAAAAAAAGQFVKTAGQQAMPGSHVQHQQMIHQQQQQQQQPQSHYRQQRQQHQQQTPATHEGETVAGGRAAAGMSGPGPAGGRAINAGRAGRGRRSSNTAAAAAAITTTTISSRKLKLSKV